MVVHKGFRCGLCDRRWPVIGSWTCRWIVLLGQGRENIGTHSTARKNNYNLKNSINDVQYNGISAMPLSHRQDRHNQNACIWFVLYRPVVMVVVKFSKLVLFKICLHTTSLTLTGKKVKGMFHFRVILFFCLFGFSWAPQTIIDNLFYFSHFNSLL